MIKKKCEPSKLKIKLDNRGAVAGKKRKTNKKHKNRPDKTVSDKQIQEYAEKHQLTPPAPTHLTIKPWVFKGNKGVDPKLHTPEIKMEAFIQYCAHIAKGKDKRSWYFEHPEITLTWQTMETYIANDKEGLFNSAHVETACAHGYRYWEQFVEDATKMAVAHDTNAMAMLMRNKFRWDRPEQGSNDTKAQVHVLLEAMKKNPARDPNTIDIPNAEVEHKTQEPIEETQTENTEPTEL